MMLKDVKWKKNFREVSAVGLYGQHAQAEKFESR